MSNEHQTSAPAAPAEPSEPSGPSEPSELSAAPSGKPIGKGAASLSGDLITLGRKDARRTLGGRPSAGAAPKGADSRAHQASAPAPTSAKPAPQPEPRSAPQPEPKPEPTLEPTPAAARPEPAEIVRESLAAMREQESTAPEQASRWRMFLRPTGKEIRLILVVYAVFLAGFLALVWL